MRKLKYNKALITGGAGFIGSHLAKKLLELEMNVVVLDNLSTGRLENVPKKCKFIKGDILDFELMKKIISDDIEIIFHEAAIVSIRESINNYFSDAQTNLMGTLNILRACEKSKVKKIIYASSMAIYDDSERPVPLNENYRSTPISPYGISKLASELYGLCISKKMGIDFIALRYFNTFGPRQAYTPYVGVITIFINRLLEGKIPIIYGDGKQKRDFVYVGDIIKGNINAMESDISGESFNIGTGIGSSINEVAEMLCSKINPRIKPIHSKERIGELRNSIADISKAKKMIHYTPKYRLQEKIDEVIKYISRQKAGSL